NHDLPSFPTRRSSDLRGRVNFYILKLAAGAQAEAVSRTIDAQFENSRDETKTQTEKDFNLGFVKQIGDIGLIVRWILFAVFFTRSEEHTSELQSLAYL